MDGGGLFCSLFGFLLSVSLGGDCLNLSRKPFEDEAGVCKDGCSVACSAAGIGSVAFGVLSIVEVSVVAVVTIAAPVAKAGGADAIVTPVSALGGEDGPAAEGEKCGCDGATGVASNDSGTELIVSVPIRGLAPADGVVPDALSLVNRGEDPSLRDGIVLLRCTEVVGLIPAGTGDGRSSSRLLCLLDEELFRLTSSSFLRLSARLLAFELDRPMIVFDRPGVVGVDGPFVGVPLCTSRTVSASAAVPCMPMRKLS